MKKQPIKKPLRLDSQTVRPLITDKDLHAVAGGVTMYGSCNMASCRTTACSE